MYEYIAGGIKRALFPDVRRRGIALSAVRHAAMVIWAWSAFFASSGLLMAAANQNLIGAVVVIALATVGIFLGFSLVVWQNVAAAIIMAAVTATYTLLETFTHRWLAAVISIIIMIVVVNGLRGALALRSGRVVFESAQGGMHFSHDLTPK
jgi:hypothetical protein